MKPLLVVALASVGFLGLALVAAPSPGDGKDYKVVEVKDGGKIKGVVKIDVSDADKDKLSFPPVEIFKDNDKGCGDKQRPTERLEWDKETLGVGNAILYLKDVASGKDWPEAVRAEDTRNGTIDQKQCRYVPHVQCLPPKTQLVILNDDGADHNIHGFRTPAGENSLGDTKFNFASEPGSKKENDAAFLEDLGFYLVKCDVHPWMSAYVFVVGNPYYAVTSAKAEGERKPGEFTIEGVPPGDYTLVVWKEGMKETPQVAGGKISAYTYSPNYTKELAVKVEAGKDTVVPEIKIPLQK